MQAEWTQDVIRRRIEDAARRPLPVVPPRAALGWKARARLMLESIPLLGPAAVAAARWCLRKIRGR